MKRELDYCTDTQTLKKHRDREVAHGEVVVEDMEKLEVNRPANKQVSRR